MLVKELHESVGAADTHGLKDADQDHLESLKVPVLVDDGVDDVRGEHLLCFASQKVAEVVHHVDSLVGVHLLVQVVGQQLLGEEVDGGSELLGKLGVLAGVKHAKLDFVHDRAYHGHNKGHIKFLTHFVC